MVAEHPILFSAPMIRALRDGSKTQTRRTAKLRVVGDITTIRVLRGEHKGSFAYLTDEHGIAWSPAGNDPLEPYPHPERCCPYGEPGDRLWVRETWALLTGNGHRVVYRADADPPMTCGGTEPVRNMKWRPSIFMRRHASRITLEVTSVRVERLHAITEEDAEAEGVDPDFGNAHTFASRDYRRSFEHLWDEINGKRAAWDSNPWVWRVEFRQTSLKGGDAK